MVDISRESSITSSQVDCQSGPASLGQQGLAFGSCLASEMSFVGSKQVTLQVLRVSQLQLLVNREPLHDPANDTFLLQPHVKSGYSMEFCSSLLCICLGKEGRLVVLMFILTLWLIDGLHLDVGESMFVQLLSARLVL